jgi:hypothetical protein
LRTFLIVCTLLALAFGWLGSILVRVRHQRAIVAQVQRAGGEVSYDYELAWEQVDGHWQQKAPPGPKLVRLLVGDDAYAHVELIDFREDRLVDVDLAWLSELPQLKRLYLSGTRITDNGIAQLAGAGLGLKFIGINCPNVTDRGVAHAARLPQLESLSIHGPKLTGDGLLPLVDAQKLQRLGLSGADVTDETLRHIDRLQQIDALTLLRTGITSSGLEPVGQLANLRELNIYEAPGVEDTAMVHLGGLKNLKALDLMASAITDDGLVHLRDLKYLESLNLWSTKASDPGMQHLIGLSKLKSLNLTGTGVGDEGVAALAGLKDLQQLHLGNTAITDNATTHLTELEQLQRLDISGTAVTDPGLSSLQTLTELRWLRVGPNVTEQGARELKAFLPNCAIQGSGPTPANSFVSHRGGHRRRVRRRRGRAGRVVRPADRGRPSQDRDRLSRGEARALSRLGRLLPGAADDRPGQRRGDDHRRRVDLRPRGLQDGPRVGDVVPSERLLDAAVNLVRAEQQTKQYLKDRERGRGRST